MSQITHTLECAVPLSYAFDYISDYRFLHEWLVVVNNFTPTSDQTRGVGAQFDGEIRFGPISTHMLLEFVEWDDNKTCAARFTKEIEGTLTLQFEALGEQHTRIKANLDYSVGTALIGGLPEQAIHSLIPSLFRFVDKSLHRQLLARYRDGAAS